MRAILIILLFFGIGCTAQDAIKFGGQDVDSVMVGGVTVWEKPSTYPVDAMVMRFVIPSDNYTLTIPFYNTTGYNGIINWKDGTPNSTITTYNDADRVHVYATAGTYDVELTGVFKGIYFNNTGNKLDLTRIVQWGNVGITVSNNAFYGCANLMGQLTFPSWLTSIGSNMFYGCVNLTGNLIIPNFVTSIGSSSFNSCSGFTSLTIPASVLTIGVYAFANCTGLAGNLIIPNSITSISTGAFRNCTGLSGNLIIPNSITSISTEFAYGCIGLSEVSIPNSIVSIGLEAFRSCTGLSEEILIPSSVLNISNFAFNGCSSNSLSFLMESSTPLTLGGSAVFDNTASTMRIKVPPSAVATYQTATYWSEYSAKIISQ